MENAEGRDFPLPGKQAEEVDIPNLKACSLVHLVNDVLHLLLMVVIPIPRAEGRIGGRHPKLDLKQKKVIIEMMTSGGKTASEAARIFKIHPATAGRYLKSKAY